MCSLVGKQRSYDGKTSSDPSFSTLSLLLITRHVSMLKENTIARAPSFSEASVIVAPRAAPVQILSLIPAPGSRPRRCCRPSLCPQPDLAAPSPAKTDPEAPHSLPILLMPGDLFPLTRSPRIVVFQFLHTICGG